MKKIVWGFFWLIAATLGGYAIWTVWQLPSEAKNAVWLGMSKNKLMMCAGMALLAVICLIAAFISWIKKDPNIFSTGKASGAASYYIIFLLILGWIFLTPPVGKTALERSFLERLTPAAYWGTAFSILTLFLLFIQKIRQIWAYQTSSLRALFWGILIFLSMAGAVYYALQSGTGLDPISGTFYRQGVSLLEGHLIIPLLVLYPLMPLILFLSSRNRSERSAGVFLRVLTCLLLWAAAVYFWQTTSFEGRSYFAPALRLPNNNFYPASDAENYDLLAQSIMLGNGFRNGLTVVRPLYAAFLALLHWIFGNDYMKLTNGQILLLALIPMFVFLIGRYLRHPGAGLLAAAWVIWREIYSIRVTPLVQVSNSRLLMSDLPTMLLVLSTVLAAVKWYRTDKKAVTALICGGLIGTAMLLRTQCFVLIPAVWLLFFCSGKKAAVILRSFLVSIIGVVLVFAPWIAWMKIHPNTTVVADTSERHYLVSLYQNAAGESDPNTSLTDVIRTHPRELLQAVGAHFLNNEISSLLVLPMRTESPSEAEQFLYDGDLFWYRENARETIETNQSLVLFYLLVISFGIISAYRCAGFGGLAPLIIHLVYNLGNALALTSGFRFILPADWALIFYFALGCTAVFRFIGNITLFTPLPETAAETKAEDDPVYGHAVTFAFACILLLLVGGILPFCDSMIPRRYEEKSQAAIAAEWKSVSENASAILAEVNEKDMVFLEGRAFYPRFYKAGEGDSGGSSSVKQYSDSDRMVWMFHDDRVHVLNCELTPEQAGIAASQPVPDPIDVIIAGLPGEDYIDVLELRLIHPSAGR